MTAITSSPARGFYNGHSRIALRVLTTNPAEAIDDAFFARRLRPRHRASATGSDLDAVTDAYRLVHSEGDGLSGLVVDRFGSTLGAGIFRRRHVSLPLGCCRTALQRHYPDSQILLVRRGARAEAGVVRLPGARAAAAGGHHRAWRALPRRRRAASTRRASFSTSATTADCWPSFCAGQRVLDLCCNTGGFAVYAKALGQAEEVIGVDLDEQALALARQNASLNQVRIRFVQADLFPWLRDIHGPVSASTWWFSTPPSRRATARRSISL